MEALFDNNLSFVIAVLALCLVAFIYNVIKLKSEEPINLSLDAVPDFYNINNTETGEIYPIVGKGEDDKVVVLQRFMVTDKTGGHLHISMQPVTPNQPRPYAQGWIEEFSGHKWLNSTSLKTRPN